MKKLFLLALVTGCLTFHSSNATSPCTLTADGNPDGTCVPLYHWKLNPKTQEPYGTIIGYYCSNQAGTRNCYTDNSQQ